MTPLKIKRIFSATIGEIARAVEFCGAIGLGVLEVIRYPKRFRTDDLYYYLDICGIRSLPIVILICYLMGVILGFQASVVMRGYGADIFIADLVGFSILRELGPLMVAMICTGRAGSAFAAEIGTMKTDDEVNALESMGISPERFLVVPKLVAMIIAVPMLTVFGNIAGILGGLTVGSLYLDFPISAYLARTREVIEPVAFILGLVKALTFAVLITYAGCRMGFKSSPDAQGVGRSATGAVVLSILLVIIADTLITYIFSLFGH